MVKKPGDIMLDATNDLLIEDGDFVVADATEQHQNCLLLANKGDYKTQPMLGVGIFMYINDDEPQDMMREIRTQFTNDGMEITKMSVRLPSTVTIEAIYK